MHRVKNVAGWALGVVGFVAGTSVAEAGDEAKSAAEREKEVAERVAEQERENARNLLVDDVGKTHLQSLEIVAATDRSAFHHDQQGRIGPGFEWSMSFKGLEEMRFLAFRHAFFWGQLGDERRAWYHMQYAHVPSFRILDLGSVALYAGPREMYEMTFVNSKQAKEMGEEEIVAHALGFGTSVGARLLDGILSAEVTLDAIAALERPFVVDGHSSAWVFPRLGFNVKTDVCALVGGGACEFPAPRPQDIDLAMVIDAAMSRLNASAQRPACAAVDDAVRFDETGPFPECGEADADGFFCRLTASSTSDAQRAVLEATRQVHTELAACYDQNRADALTATRLGKLLRQKMQYGAYPPQFRRLLGCDTRSNDAERVRVELARKAPIDEAAEERAEAEACRLVDAEAACPRAELALVRLESLIEAQRKGTAPKTTSPIVTTPPSTSTP